MGFFILETVVDEEGKVKDGYEVEVAVTAKDGESFQVGDRVLVTVTYKVAESTTVSGKRGTYVR